MFILAVLSASFYTSPRAIFLRQIISFHFPVQNLVTASHYTEDRSPSPQWGSPSPGLCLPLKLLPLCTCYTPAWSLPPLPTSSSSFRPQLKLLLKWHFFKALPIQIPSSAPQLSHSSCDSLHDTGSSIRSGTVSALLREVPPVLSILSTHIVEYVRVKA